MLTFPEYAAADEHEHATFEKLYACFVQYVGRLRSRGNHSSSQDILNLERCRKDYDAMESKESSRLVRESSKSIIDSGFQDDTKGKSRTFSILILYFPPLTFINFFLFFNPIDLLKDVTGGGDSEKKISWPRPPLLDNPSRQRDIDRYFQVPGLQIHVRRGQHRASVQRISGRFRRDCEHV
jgi:hypothetical protein